MGAAPSARAAAPQQPLAVEVPTGVPSRYPDAQRATASATADAGRDLLTAGLGLNPCRYGENCYNHDPEHRRRFDHPTAAPAAIAATAAAPTSNSQAQAGYGAANVP